MRKNDPRKTNRRNLGQTKHPLYHVWTSMRQRVNDKKRIDYPRYGGRGIKICAEWGTFAGFISDMGASYSQGLTLDRIDVNGDYCKENCRWSDRIVQANNRRNTKVISHNGFSGTLIQWAKYLEVGRSKLAQRLYVYKWPIERVLTK